MDVDQAVATGAMALFDEKYGDKVRVVTVKDVSKELCGGTHTRASGDIGVFKILSEVGIAAGVRRIEAVAGRQAYQAFKREEQSLRDIAQLLKTTDLDVAPRVEKLVAQIKGLEKELDQFKHKLQSSQAGDVIGEARDDQRRQGACKTRGQHGRQGPAGFRRQAAGQARLGHPGAGFCQGRQGEPDRHGLEGPDRAGSMPGILSRKWRRSWAGPAAASPTWPSPAEKTPAKLTRRLKHCML